MTLGHSSVGLCKPSDCCIRWRHLSLFLLIVFTSTITENCLIYLKNYLRIFMLLNLRKPSQIGPQPQHCNVVARKVDASLIHVDIQTVKNAKICLTVNHLKTKNIYKRKAYTMYCHTR